MTELETLKRAVACLCDAIKRLERSVDGFADSDLLDECKKLRKQAEREILR